MSTEASKSPIDEIVGWYWEYGCNMKLQVRAALEGARIIYAVYESESYSGSSILAYERDGKFYLNRDSHCSCNGMTFNPQEFASDEALLAAIPWSPDRDRVAAALKAAS